jgi:polygalacturonase
LLRREFFSASTFALGLAAPSVASAGSIPAAKSILDYGARPDGRTLNTQAIQRAIDDVFQAGGGLVYAPPASCLAAPQSATTLIGRAHPCGATPTAIT